jgi:hypothetical protein
VRRRDLWPFVVFSTSPHGSNSPIPRFTASPFPLLLLISVLRLLSPLAAIAPLRRDSDWFP